MTTIWNRVKEEITQHYNLRKPIISKIGKYFENRYVVSFYTNFETIARIDNQDIGMLRTLLGGSKKVRARKIIFLISSLGGDPLAAEKMIKVLREYSDNDYWVVIPDTAKSAATMVCLGASKIILSPVSELGPIDLQIEREGSLIPAHSVITAYDNLIEKGVNLHEGQRIEPILQQLQNFDPSEIEYYRQVNELSSDIAVKVLKNGMLKGFEHEKIKEMINILLDPTKSKTHGRPIFYSDIKEVDKENNLELQLIDLSEKIWEDVTEYHTRLTFHLKQTRTLKVIESEEMSFMATGG